MFIREDGNRDLGFCDRDLDHFQPGKDAFTLSLKKRPLPYGVALSYFTMFFTELVVFCLPQLSLLHELARLRQTCKIELYVAPPWFSLLHFAVTGLKISIRIDDKLRPVTCSPGRFFSSYERASRS